MNIGQKYIIFVESQNRLWNSYFHILIKYVNLYNITYITLYYGVFHGLFAALEPCNRVVILHITVSDGERVDPNDLENPENQESLRRNCVTALYNIALLEWSNKIPSTTNNLNFFFH